MCTYIAENFIFYSTLPFYQPKSIVKSWMLDKKSIKCTIVSFAADSSSAITASKMGTIMAVVAVLEIHIERKAVGKMKPRINILLPA